MNGLEVFTKLFGDLTVLRIVEYVIVIGFLIKLWGKTKKYISDNHDAEQRREAELREALEGVRALPEYKAENLKIQRDLESKFNDVKKMCENIMGRLDAIEARRDESERKKIQATLLQSFRIFADETKNPMMAWSEMEADSFWQMFELYESYNGNGFMHSHVQPAMQALEVIPMEDKDRLTELMRSRVL